MSAPTHTWSYEMLLFCSFTYELEYFSKETFLLMCYFLPSGTLLMGKTG